MEITRWRMSDDEMAECEEGEWVRYKDAYSVEGQRIILGEIVSSCADSFIKMSNDCAAVGAFLKIVGDHATGTSVSISPSEVMAAYERCMRAMGGEGHAVA